MRKSIVVKNGIALFLYHFDSFSYILYPGYVGVSYVAWVTNSFLKFLSRARDIHIGLCFIRMPNEIPSK